jgi:hypothetical protein
MPAGASRQNSFQFTLRLRTWLVAEAAVVNISAAWTLAEAAAGGTPKDSSMVELITPYAMPRAPSTI